MSQRKHKKQRDASLALCMIVKNEEKNLFRCLASVRGLASEIIVVDTGSTDSTLQIARSFGAKTRQVPWRNDFSLARNESLGMAKADWILVLDADEVLSPEATPLIKSALKKPGIAAFTVPTRNYTNDRSAAGFIANDRAFKAAAECAGWVESRKVRLFRNLPQVRFEGRLHELVEPSIRRLGGRIESLDVPVHHFGYVGSDEALKPKLESMEAIARAKCQEAPEDYKAHYELGVILARLGRLEEAQAKLESATGLNPDFALAQYDLGTVLSRLGRLNEAARQYEMAARLEPGGFDALYNLAATLQNLRRFEEAEPIYQRLLNEHPLEKRVWNNYGALCASMGRLDEAEKAFRKALAIDPRFTDARTNLQKLEQISGPAHQATEDPNICLLMIVKNECENLRELLPQIAASFDEIVIVDTGSQDETVAVAEKYTERVYQALWADDFSAARNFALERASAPWIFWMDADDRIDGSHCRLLKKYLSDSGKAFFITVASGSEDGGAEFLQLRLFPRLPGIEWRGRVHEQILPSLQEKGIQFEALPDVVLAHRGYDDAELARQKTLRNLRLLERERSERPADANVLHHLAQAYGMLGKPEQAVEILEKLVQILAKCPSDEFSLHAMNLLVQHCALLGQADKSRAYAQRILELDPANALVKYFLGEIAFRNGRFAEAIEWLRMFSASPSRNGLIAIPWKALRANALNYLGLALAKTGKTAEAVVSFQAAIKEGARIEAHKNLASLLFEQKNFAHAAVVLAAVVEKEPSNANLWVNYGVASARSNDFDRAAVAFERALSLDPHNSAAKQNLSVVRKMLSSSVDIKKPYSLSTCIIARNEEKFIQQAIDSVQPISDEVIVVDTGSTDATVEIARGRGARVECVEWKDDFSAARNAALELASSDWILILDADEVMAASDLARFAELAPAAEVWGYAMVTRNYSADRRVIGWQPSAPSEKEACGQPGWFPSSKVRLFRNLPEIRFEGYVHECVEPSILRTGKRIENLDVPVHHYGYIEDRTSKQRYYLELTKRKAQEKPLDERAQYQLGIQYLDRGEFAEAERALEQAIELDNRNAAALLNLAVAKIHLEKLEEAHQLLAQAVALNPSSSCAHYNLGVVLERLGHFDQAECHYQEAASLDGNDANAMAKLGYLKARAGKWEAAREHLEQALLLDPAHQTARSNLEYVQRMAASEYDRCDLSLNMIVKDEERNLREGLAPIAHLFDEIIVVDTGSSDATAEVAAELGARVIQHPWSNNFAEARNAALEHSSGKWIFWLDADDRIEPRAVETLRKFIARGIPCGVFFPLESKVGTSGALLQNYMLRLFPRAEGVFWQGRVHEQIAQSLKRAGIELVNCPDFTVQHVGYERDGDVLQKNLRNLKLLAAELAERPEDPYVLFALAQAFLLCGHFEQGAGWLRTLWRLRETVQESEWKEVFWMAAIVLADCAVSSGAPMESEEWLKKAIELAPENWLPYFLLGERKLLSGDVKDGLSLLRRADGIGLSPTILPLNVDEFRTKLRQYLLDGCASEISAISG